MKPEFVLVEFLESFTFHAPLTIYEPGDRAEIREWLAKRLIERGAARKVEAAIASEGE